MCAQNLTYNTQGVRHNWCLNNPGPDGDRCLFPAATHIDKARQNESARLVPRTLVGRRVNILVKFYPI